MNTWRIYCVAICALAGTLIAQAAILPDCSEGLLDRDEIIARAAQVDREAYPNADAVLVDDYILAGYEPNGISETWDDYYVKVLTEKGKRASKTQTFWLMPPHYDAFLALAEVIKPDGSIEPVDIATQSRVMTDRSQMASNIYNPNRKLLHLNIPNLEVGDMLHVIVRRDVVKPRVPDTWSDYQTFEMEEPILHTTYEVLAPKELPLQSIALKGEVADTITASQSVQGDRLRYRWEISNVPRYYAEPDMPESYTCVQRLLVSTIPDWPWISRWYWDLCVPHLETVTPEMKEKVAELIDGKDDEMAQIRSIFRWVSQEVRYMGITIEKDAPGYEPHDVSLTFENRHGVCRDKSALLVAMLRLADLDAYPILIHSGPRKDEEVPQPYFNHAVSCVQLKDGQYVLMDSTDENTKDLFPAYLNDCSYLVARPEGEELLLSPIIPAEENLVIAHTEAELDAEGNLTAETTLDFNGINDNAYRGYFSRLKLVERRQFFEGVVKHVAAGAKLGDLTIKPDDLLNTEEPMSVHMTYTAEDVLVGDEGTRMIPMMTLGTRVGIVNFVLGKTGLKERRFPLKTDIACGVREEFRVQIDPALGELMSVPTYETLDSPTLLRQRTVTHEDGTLVNRGDFQLRAVEFSPAEYLELKEDLKDIEYGRRKMAILAPDEATAGADADVRILERTAQYQLQDSHNWMEHHYAKIEILTYKGKKDYSELKLDYNPIWETIEIKRAIVTTGDQTAAVSEQEINELDAAWAGSAPRYPAAKTMVVSLPSVEIGSVIEYEYVRENRDHPFFSATIVGREFNPVKHKEVRLTAPADVPVKTFYDDNGVAVGDQPERYQTRNLEQLSDAPQQYRIAWTDQPAIKSEKHLPPIGAFVPLLRFTTEDNWQNYAQLVNEALTAATLDQAKTTQRAQELVASASSPREKIKAIRDFVAENIRLAGPSIDELPLDYISPADTTLEQGYGHRADRAVLLATMLKAAGFEPEFTMASSGSRLQVFHQVNEQVPSLSKFSRVLVHLQIPEEQGQIWLNDTDQYDALEATPSAQQQVLYLQAQQNGSRTLPAGRVGIIKAPLHYHDGMDHNYHIELDEQGNAIIEVRRQSNGMTYGNRKKLFAEMPPEERRRFFMEMIADISQAAEVVEALQTDFEDYPGYESFTVRVPRFAVRDGDRLYMLLPASLANILDLRADTRTNPLALDQNSLTHVKTEVVLPAGMSKVLWAPQPSDYDLSNQNQAIRVFTYRDGDTLVLEQFASMHPIIVDPIRYTELLEIDRQLSHREARTLLLTTP